MKPLEHVDGLEAFRAPAAGGRDFWRTLEEWANTDAFQKMARRDYPHLEQSWGDPVNRRHFLRLLGASLALAGLTGCSPAPQEPILPYVQAPQGMIPGRPLYFASTIPQDGYGVGVLVESHEGRPTKVDGNPDHPACPRPQDVPARSPYGPSNAFAQASILTLYDPDRSRAVTHLGQIASLDAFVAAFRTAMRSKPGGARLHILTETVTSPSLAYQLTSLLKKVPGARWYVDEFLGQENVHLGARQAFGELVATHYRLEQADLIVSLDSDFLSCGPAQVRHQVEFASRRRQRRSEPEQKMNRLYMLECSFTITGAVADHRLPLRPAEIETAARALAAALDPSFRHLSDNRAPGPWQGWVAAVADDLRRHRGKCVVLAGACQPPFVHALAHALNSFLGNVGHTVHYTAPVEFSPELAGSLKDLADEMAAGHVDILAILGGNPVYTAPVDLDFAGKMARVPLRFHQALHEDETSAHCHWHIPQAHYLESWDDLRAHDGTLSFSQPLIAPLYGGTTAQEMLAVLLDAPERSCYQLVRGFYRSLFDDSRPGAEEVRAFWHQYEPHGFTGEFETWWQKALHAGVVEGTQARGRAVRLRTDWAGLAPVAVVPGNGLDVVFRADPTLHDGRFANNGWLQELPKPLTQLTWGNAVLISPATAVRLRFTTADHPEEANEKEVELTCQGRSVIGPIWVLPGLPENTVTIHLGHGRTRAGHVGTGVGFNANLIRMSSNPWFAGGGTLRGTGGKIRLAATQQHHLMEGRDVVITGTPEQPPVIPTPPSRRLTLYDDSEHLQAAEQWGMVIDLSSCTSCKACVVACQAENNIPVVGKEDVLRGREMHWLRVDSYHRGPPANPETYFQPVPCMHCENAPCELVCPVDATVHSSDGLNDMVYNRCVGTRYCSNNCPYKVRRFNFFQFADWTTDTLQLMRNPEVTVRSRGVMEKCTYCVQRIRIGQIQAGREDRAVRDGDVVTACQAACPAGAITFGNLKDRTSKVAGLMDEPARYALLAELNTRPRTTYLAAYRNPNPEITAAEGGR